MAMDAKSRLRGSFADILQRQAVELGQLANDAVRDPDIRDALVYELERIRGTAVSLGVEPVDRAAQQAMAAAEGGNLIEAVNHLMDVCRSLEGLESAFRPVVLLAEEPPDADEHMAVLRVAEDIDKFVELVKTEDPCALVVRVDDLSRVLSKLEGRSRAVPVFAMGPAHDLDRRLMASQLGAQAYLSEPLDLGRVLKRVRARTGESDPPPYRILLVEPDQAMGKMALRALEGPGRTVRWQTDTMGLLSAIDELAPELIVLATEVGPLGGLELASVIRAHERYGDVPVLFLASQEDVERTGFLMSADDVLLKPFPPPVLRGRATARLERFRRSQREQEVDRLTSCLSRAALLRAADREVGLSRRAGQQLSVVLVDIDGMHGINEKMGLPFGDRILVAFAEVVAYNLRETDLVGRIGGDSFGLLLPKCGALDARKRLENVRRKFDAWLEGQNIKDVSFSAGIADTTAGYRDVMARADRALIDARHAGGGRSNVSR